MFLISGIRLSVRRVSERVQRVEGFRVSEGIGWRTLSLRDRESRGLFSGYETKVFSKPIFSFLVLYRHISDSVVVQHFDVVPAFLRLKNFCVCH